MYVFYYTESQRHLLLFSTLSHFRMFALMLSIDLGIRQAVIGPSVPFFRSFCRDFLLFLCTCMPRMPHFW